MERKRRRRVNVSPAFSKAVGVQGQSPCGLDLGEAVRNAGPSPHGAKRIGRRPGRFSIGLRKAHPAPHVYIRNCLKVLKRQFVLRRPFLLSLQIQKRRTAIWQPYFPARRTANFCWLSYEPENTVAKSLYASFGFVETGEKDGEEQIAVLKL